jgi:hypothetical protein
MVAAPFTRLTELGVILPDVADSDTLPLKPMSTLPLPSMALTVMGKEVPTDWLPMGFVPSAVICRLLEMPEEPNDPDYPARTGQT